jgi:methylthioribose-1-phosphate isomerase
MFAAALSDEIVTMAVTLYRRGWMPGTAGNISTRDGDDRMLITGSGLSKGELTHRDLVPVQISDSTSIDVHGPRPSAETTIHAAVYRATGCGAVVHVHSPFATAVSARYGRVDGLATMAFRDYELIKGFGLADPAGCAVPMFPNWADVPRIARDVEHHLTGNAMAPPVLLITGHGATSWGRDCAQARDRMECLEALCELVIHTGSPHLSAARSQTTREPREM